MIGNMEQNTEKNSKIPAYLIRLEETLEQMGAKIEEQQNSLDEMRKQFQYVNKTARRLIDKQKMEYNRPAMPRKCGFAKETSISDELCDFIQVERGTKVPRTKITKYLMEYIKTNNLVNPENKKQVVPDEKLWKILGDEARQTPDTLTHFTIQKYMNRHF